MTDNPTTMAQEGMGPIAARMPEYAREAWKEGRKAAAQQAAWLTYLPNLSAQDRAAMAARERDALAAEARRELAAGRAAQRWAMWCHQVPRLYLDERADCDSREPHTYEWWLNQPRVQHGAALASWLRGDSPTLLLLGDTGTYKTATALQAGYAAAAAAVHTLYTSQLDYTRQLRPGGVDDPAGFRDRYAKTSLLIFDDLGAETEMASEFVRQEVVALLDQRLREGRRQIVSSNITDPDDLRGIFGDRIVSRLMDRAVVLGFEGEDNRAPRSAA